jgi:hypothetical protein
VRSEKKYKPLPVSREIHERLNEKDFHQGLDYYEVVRRRHSAAALVVYRPRVLTYRRTVITILYLRLLLPPYASAVPLYDNRPCQRFSMTCPRFDSSPRRVASFITFSTVNFVDNQLTMHHREIIRLEETRHESRDDDLPNSWHVSNSKNLVTIFACYWRETWPTRHGTC